MRLRRSGCELVTCLGMIPGRGSRRVPVLIPQYPRVSLFPRLLVIRLRTRGDRKRQSRVAEVGPAHQPARRSASRAHVSDRPGWLTRRRWPRVGGRRRPRAIGGLTQYRDAVGVFHACGERRRRPASRHRRNPLVVIVRESRPRSTAGTSASGCGRTTSHRRAGSRADTACLAEPRRSIAGRLPLSTGHKRQGRSHRHRWPSRRAEPSRRRRVEGADDVLAARCTSTRVGAAPVEAEQTKAAILGGQRRRRNAASATALLKRVRSSPRAAPGQPIDRQGANASAVREKSPSSIGGRGTPPLCQCPSRCCCALTLKTQCVGGAIGRMTRSGERAERIQEDVTRRAIEAFEQPRRGGAERRGGTAGAPCRGGIVDGDTGASARP